MSGNLKRQLSQHVDPRLSLADFVVGDSEDPLVPPLAFTQWRQAGAWEATIYEPELLGAADARTTINYEGKPRTVINLCSYNYLGLANRPEVIAAALRRRKGRRQLVIVEGVYSMDGDFASLDGLLDVADAHKASAFIDEAHSMLGCGAHGRGAAEHFDVEKRIPLVYGTFSKAFAAVGGFIA